MQDLHETLAELISRVPGWCFVEKAVQLYELVQETRPRLVVEIGVYGGKSLLSIAASLRANGQGKVVGIDPWAKAQALQGIDWVDEQMKEIDWDALYLKCHNEIEVRGLAGFVELKRMTSEKAAGAFEESTVDFLHIDGNHATEKVSLDLKTWLPKVKPGSFVVMDDIRWATVRAGIDPYRDQLDLAEGKQQKVLGDYYWAIYRKR